MHACGHDLHMAALVGAVELLAADRASLPGTVVAVFQPGEEGYGGAELMLRAGVLGAAGAPPVASFALHVFSYLPRGLFFTRPGVVMAGLRIMRLEVHGRGGHAARPSEARDPITTTAEIIQSMQSFVSRRVSPADPAVVTVGSLHAGSSPTVIPDVAVLELSIRTLSAETETMLLDKLPRLAAAIAAGHGLTVTATVLKTMPPTVNDEESVDDIRAAVSATVGEDRNRTLDFPEMVSEDFSYFLGRTGGAMVLLGAEDPAAGADGQTPSNHSPYARFDDRVVPEAALVLSSVARLRLARSSQ
jgi:hippurate hydrolase